LTNFSRTNLLHGNIYDFFAVRCFNTLVGVTFGCRSTPFDVNIIYKFDYFLTCFIRLKEASTAKESSEIFSLLNPV
jgi:hypothetical protein